MKVVSFESQNRYEPCLQSCSKQLFYFIQARSAQVPLIMAGKSMATSSTNYFNAAKSLAVNSKDQSGWQQLAQQAKAVSDAMRRLITAIK